MQNTTPFYKSRTFWVNAVALLSLVFPACREFFESNPIEAGSALAAVNVLLKFVTLGKHEIVDDTTTKPQSKSNISGGSLMLFLYLVSISMFTSCGHDVTITPDRTEVSKDGSILIVDKTNATLSFSQAPVQTSQPTIINLPAKK